MTMITKEKAEALDGHTPGPWRVRANKGDSQDECALSICGDIFVLADLSGPQYTHQHPNARLIAAAPEMRDTIIALHERVERLEVVSALLDVEVNGGGLGDAGRIEARAVLKKVYAHD